MATLERRIEALEAAGTDVLEVVALRKIIDPANPGRRVQTAMLGEERFYRADDESEADFIARLHGIAGELHRAGKGPVRIIANDIDMAL